MKPNHFVLACGLALLLAAASVSAAQDLAPPKFQIQEVKPPPLSIPSLAGGALISPSGLEKLALSKDQKTDFDKLNDEFTKKQKELQNRLFDLAKAGNMNQMREAFEAQQKLRPDYLAKVEKLLTDDQKKTFEQVRREFPGIGIGPNGFRPPMMPPFGPQVGGQFLPAEAQQRLKLTDDQKKQVDELQKELETKILKLLTDDQKKAFEEMKKQRFGPGFFPPPPGLPPAFLDKAPLPPGANPLVPPALDPVRPPEVTKIDK